jgi:hypothetical protein
MSIYDINYRDFVADYLPPDKREERQIAWLTSLLKPLDTLHIDTFGDYKEDIIYRAKQNGQRILMESILNDTFGVIAAPFIYIDNTGDDITSQIFFNQSEGLPPVWFFQESETTPVYFNNESELTNNKQFKVYVPVAVYAAVGENAIKAEVDRLRPYSTIYTIIQY